MANPTVGQTRRRNDNNPKNGDTTVKEGHTFVYKNGKWVKATKPASASRPSRNPTAAQVRGAQARGDKPAAKPKPKATPAGAKPALSSEGIRDHAGRVKRTVPTGSEGYNNWRNRQIELERKRLKNVGNPPAKPSPAPSGNRPSTSSSSRSSGSTSTPKPAGKVPSSTDGMKNQNKDFRGNPERKDSIASTLRELRGMGSGRKVSGVGPVSSGSDYAKAKNDAAISKAQSDANKARVNQGPGAKKETLKERMERMKKLRNRTSWGGAD